jgi:hypothetical protein
MGSIRRLSPVTQNGEPDQRRTMHFVGHFSIAASQETSVFA